MIVLIVTAYSPTLKGDFIWDDDSHLTKNPLITCPDGLRRIWIFTEPPLYLPLTFTTFWVGHKLWGFNPLGYHIVNISLHTITVLLLWLLLKNLRIPGAWWAAMAVALHPVAVESVAWITELKNVQSGLFFIATIICYLRFREGKGIIWYLLALLLFAAALLSKTSTVMLPVILLLCNWWQYRSWKWNSVIKLIPFFIFSTLTAIACIWYELNQVYAQGPEWTASFAEKIARAGWIIWFYLYKLILPLKLTFIYPRWTVDPFRVISYFPAVTWLFLLFILWWKRQSWGRAMFFGLAYFTINLFPVMGFFNIYGMRYSYVADHWQYLSSIGIITLVVSSMISASEYLRQVRGTIAAGLLVKYLVALLVTILMILTWYQTDIYHNMETLWSDNIAKNPQSWIGHHNLGMVFLGQGKSVEAIKHFSRAALLNSSETSNEEVHIGVAYDRQGQPEKAIAHFRESLRIDPGNAPAHSSLAIVFYKAGKIDEAVAHLQEALRVNPYYAPAHNNLGIIFAHQGKTEDAISHYLEALKINPIFMKPHQNLAILLEKEGRLNEAIHHYRKAVAINPTHGESHYNLGVLLLKTGNREESIAQFSKALELDPALAEKLRITQRDSDKSGAPKR